MALQASNFDGLLIVDVHDARAFAQNVHWTNARTTEAEDIGFQNRHRRTAQISRGNFLDEARNVNMSWTGDSARRVKTK